MQPTTTATKTMIGMKFFAWEFRKSGRFKGLLFVGTVFIFKLLCFSNSLGGVQDSIKTSEVRGVQLDQVQLFREGVSLRYRLNLTKPAPQQRLVLGGLAASVDPGSLRIRTSPGLGVSEYKWVTLPVALVCPDSLKAIAASVQALRRILEDKQVDLHATQVEERYLMALIGTFPTQVASQETAQTQPEAGAVQEWIKASEPFGNRLLLLGRRKLNQQRILDSLGQVLASLEQKQQDWQNRCIPKEQGLMLQVEASAAAQSKDGHLALELFSTQAGWTPEYQMDVQVDRQEMALSMGARMHQETGQDWSGVQVSFMTHTPRPGLEIPSWSPWHLDFYRPGYRSGIQEVMQLESLASTASRSKSRVESEAPEESGLDWNSLQGIGGQGSRSLTGSAYVYQAPKPVSLASGSQQWLPLDHQTVKVDLMRYAAPRLSPVVYLMGVLRDSTLLDWVDGTCRISVEGNRVGEQNLQWGRAADSLVLSLGTDEAVQVQYRPAGIYKDKRFRLDHWVFRHYGYRVDIRNGRSVPVRLRLEDQFPISLTKEIEVVDLIPGGGRILDAGTPNAGGVIRWDLNLQPGIPTGIEWGFRVKHPRNKPIQGL
jgi:uncharacterized protein (TIGR02231 family)